MSTYKISAFEDYKNSKLYIKCNIYIYRYVVFSTPVFSCPRRESLFKLFLLWPKDLYLLNYSTSLCSELGLLIAKVSKHSWSNKWRWIVLRPKLLRVPNVIWKDKRRGRSGPRSRMEDLWPDVNLIHLSRISSFCRAKQISKESGGWSIGCFHFFHPLSLPSVQKLQSCDIFSPSKSCIFKELSLEENFISVSLFLICGLTKSPGWTSGSAEHIHQPRKCGAEPFTRLPWSDPTVVQPHSLTHAHVIQLDDIVNWFKSTEPISVRKFTFIPST